MDCDGVRVLRRLAAFKDEIGDGPDNDHAAYDDDSCGRLTYQRLTLQSRLLLRR